MKFIQLFRRYRSPCPLSTILRNKSGLRLWDKDINTEIKLAIESYWKVDVLESSVKGDNGVRYILSMFPYPSGQLHMGHVRVYSISDTLARFYKMNGHHVIHPMGWDAFGLPAENAAFERNVLPECWTTSNISAMKEQLLQLGFNFDWNREITTCKPSYYKWTQYIFLKLFENGLAYQAKAVVNWDPVDRTVLADEQVDDNGCSWRSGAKVEKKLLNQWYIKTTKFAKQLYDGLDDEALIDWKDITNLQKHWIGECDGITVKFKLKSTQEIPLDYLDIWTSMPEKIMFGQFIAIKSDSLLCHTTASDVTENIVLPLVAQNPLNGRDLPIVITNRVEYPEGRDVYIACPTICATDKDLAFELNLNLSYEISPNMKVDEYKNQVIETVERTNIGVYPVSSKLKDWLISRQRYWGTPIPIIHCKTCGAVPVPYEDLPVQLLKIESIVPGSSPLSENQSWLNCLCPKCGASAKRETDTMDTFVDSSWYFLRFLDPCNDQRPFDTEVVKSYFPVDLYIGGKEHAVLHLYYARFIAHFLHSINWTSQCEPFKKLLVQGMVMGQSYRLKSSGKYLPVSKVKFENDKIVHADTGETVETQWEKMSKSKYNGENPQNLLNEYGCDATRLVMLADVTPATHRHWSNSTFPGILNWQHRLWLTLRNLITYRNECFTILETNEFKKHEEKLWEARNYFTAQTTYHYKHTHHLSIAISRLQGLTNKLRKAPPEVMAKSAEYELALSALIIMLAPVAPHFCCELWSGLQNAPNRINTDNDAIDWDGNVFQQTWPSVDDHFQLTLICKVDGANRSELKLLPKELEKLSHEEAVKLMLNQKEISKRVKKGICRTVFDNYPGCGATLNIFTVQTKKVKPIEVSEIEN